MKKKDVGYAPFENIDGGEYKGLLYKMLNPDANLRLSAKEILDFAEKASVPEFAEDSIFEPRADTNSFTNL